jgi:type IV secretory pathway VirB10-like protein
MRDAKELGDKDGLAHARDRAQLERAQELLAAVAPLTSSRARMTRVWRALENASSPEPTRVRRRLTLALSLGLVLLLTAFAAAQGVVAVRALLANVTQGEASIVRSVPKGRERRPVPAQVRASEAPALPAAEPLAIEPPSPASETRVAAPRPSHHERPGTMAERSAQRASEAELVRLAVRALRRAGDPALAARLLEQAYTANPRSALAEEMMSLRVEAALARGDARAESYARQYLARYPAGRYCALVAKALHD